MNVINFENRETDGNLINYNIINIQNSIYMYSPSEII